MTVTPELRDRVATPGLLLAVIGGLTLLSGLGLSALALLVTAFGAFDGSIEGFDLAANLTQVVCQGMMALVFGGVMLAGGLRMRQFASYPLAVGGAVVSCLPCVGPCCLISLPVGIYALVTLLDSEVKAGFDAPE